MTIAPIVNNLIDTFAAEPEVTKVGTGYNVSRTVSVLAVIYEKARNAVEFRAEHLIRRAAIERILKRRVMLDGAAGPIAANLITELLWARYIDSSLVDEAKESELTLIIDKYLVIKQAISAGHANIPWDFVLGIASSEIDEAIIPAKKREALLYFFYQSVRSKVTLPGIDEQQTDLITLVASERAYMKADDALIAFHLVRLLKPSWVNNTSDITQKDVSEFAALAQSIRAVLNNPALAPVFRFLRKQVPPYLLLRDFFFDVGKDARAFVEDPAKLEEKLTEIAARRYNETGKKVRTAMIRSFIYIFLTKMLFALALEAPYDIYVAKRLMIVPLLINTLFPPIMLFLVAGLFSVPGADNTRRLIDRIKKALYHFDELKAEEDTLRRDPGIPSGP